MEGMTIKEAAKKLDVEAHVLRYWEDELSLEIKRNSMGHRFYDERDIKLFKEVKAMKAQGLALKDIKNAIIRYKRAKMKENTDTEEATGVQDICESNEDSGKQQDIKVVDFKQAQLQTVMNKIIANALRENKDIITSSIKAEITCDVMKQFDVVMREKEEREEERFRRLDDVLRQMQRANAEAAATKTKKRLFGRK